MQVLMDGGLRKKIREHNRCETHHVRGQLLTVLQCLGVLRVGSCRQCV
jgi:hypothetical protein